MQPIRGYYARFNRKSKLKYWTVILFLENRQGKAPFSIWEKRALKLR